jgi:hypothetical protein
MRHDDRGGVSGTGNHRPLLLTGQAVLTGFSVLPPGLPGLGAAQRQGRPGTDALSQTMVESKWLGPAQQTGRSGRNAHPWGNHDS